MKSGTAALMKLTLLPGITPRVRRLFFSGFGHIAWFTAQAFAALRMLPRNHPYLNPRNQGRYGIANVMHEARRNLVCDRHHMDQVVLYYTIMIGFAILFAQFVMIVVAISIRTASAMPTTMAGFFVTQNNTTDIAFNLLDLVFGFPNIFNSNSIARAGPFHTAMHTLFEFYNVGLIAVAIIIFLYLVVTVVAETAISGEPFGQRFNGAWAPLRLIWAIGMLCPLTFGMNGAQIATLYIAKLGSSMATNGWFVFLDKLGADTPLGRKESLVVMPEAPALNSLVEFMFVARTCSHYEFLANGRTINAYLISGNNARLYMTYGGAFSTDFDGARAFSGNHDIVIRFGEESPDYVNNPGGIKPICGEMVFPVTDVTLPGPLYMQSNNFMHIWELWTDPANDPTALNIVKHWLRNENRNPNAPVPAGGGSTQDFVRTTFDDYNRFATADIPPARDEQIASARWDERFRELGWAGAAIWYNKLAEMNGSFVSTVHSLPRAEKYPEVMEAVAEQKRAADESIEPQDRYRPFTGDNLPIDFSGDFNAAMAYYQAQSMWQSGYVQPKNISLLDSISAIFGLQDLFSMRRNIDLNVNPLAVLVGMGRGLVESAIVNMGYSFGAGVIGGLANIIGLAPLNTIGVSIAKFTMMIATLAIGIGVILFYVIPFLPFLYFLFSAGTWVKSLFQALVAMPLWAISHINIDGEGLPGRFAMDGYFLLFEVFARPILTVMGLIGGLLVFNAQTAVLNEIWDLVTSNVTGFNYADPAAAAAVGTTTGAGVGAIAGMRGILDQLMFTVIYGIVVYMMALASFKMADAVPDNIIRWLGSSVESFGQFDPNPAEGMVTRVQTSISLMTNSINPLTALLLRNQS